MNELNELNEQILKIISKASGIDRSQLDENTPIGNAGINSITFIEIIVKIEQEVGIEIDDEDLDMNNFVIIKDLLTALEKKI